MRSAGNFHPEWGYLAPAPSFMRTVRVALVATAIGAVGGAVVVVSLVERPGANANTALAAHALLTRAPVIKSPAVVSRTAEAAVAKAVAAAPRAPAPQATVATTALSTQPAPSDVASISKPDKDVASISKPDKADSISPPLPLAKPTDGAVAAADATPLPAEADAAVAPDTATERRTSTKRSVRRHRYESYRRQENARRRWRDNGGFGPLFGLFSFRTGSPYSSN